MVTGLVHSPPSTTSHLRDISVLLIDQDRHLSILIKRVLRSLGFNTVYVAIDGSSALALMKKKSIDLVITDWDMQPMSGIDFIRHIRNHVDSPNPFVPIIMLTGYARRLHVETARDTGITEFVAKPFTAKTLCQRIVLIIDRPRNFVISHLYKGPDRRRLSKEQQSLSERRDGTSTFNLIRCQTQDIESAYHSIDHMHDICMVDADYRLKDKLQGTSAHDVLNYKRVQDAQHIIFQSRDHFLEWVLGDLDEFEDIYRAICVHQSGAVKRMTKTALRMKSRAGIFQYELASRVAESLHYICIDKDFADSYLQKAIRQHLNALYIIFRDNITGMGGSLGTDLLENLYYLCLPYMNKSV